MAVSVQLPGYNRGAVAENIANVVNAGTSAYHNIKASNLADEETKKAQIQNQALQQQTDQGNAFKKAADTPGTPESNTIKTQHSMLLSALTSSGAIKDQGGKTALSDWNKQIQDPSVSGWKLDQMTQNNSAMKEVSDLVKAKMNAEAMGNKFAGITQTRQDANQMRANTAYDNVIGKKYEDRLDAAQRVQDLIHKARTGQLIPSEMLGQQLATDINLLQSGKSTVSGTEHSRPNTLFGRIGTLEHFASGDPKAALTDADLGQMEKEAGILYTDIGNQHQAKFSSWIKGQPKDIQPALNSRFQESRAQYFPQGSQGSRLDADSGKGGAAAPTIDPKTMTREQKIKLLQGG